MTKSGKAEAKYSANRVLASSSVLIILVVGFLSMFLLYVPAIHNAYAVSPQFQQVMIDDFDTGSTITHNVAWNPSTFCTPSSCLTYEWAVYLVDNPASTHAISITDNLSCATNNVYTKAASAQTAGNGDGSPATLEIWYSTIVCAPNVASFTLTINYNAVCSSCSIVYIVSNQPMTYANKNEGNPTSFTQSNVNAGNFKNLNNGIFVQPITFTGQQQYVTLALGWMNNTGTASTSTLNAVAPLQLIHGTSAAGLFTYDTSQATISPQGGSPQQSFSMIAQATAASYTTYNCGFLGALVCQTWQMYLLVAVFVQGQIQNPSCTICGGTDGGTNLDTTTTFSLMGNTTYIYTATAGNAGIVIDNLTTVIHSYTNGGAGKSSDYFYLMIYSLANGVNQNTNQISSANPLKLIYTQAYTPANNNAFTTAVHNQHLSVIPNTQIAPGTTYAIALFSRFNGVRINGTTNQVVMYQDSVDVSVPQGSPPLNLGSASTFKPPLYFFDLWIMPQIITTSTLTSTTTFTCLAGSTCTTATGQTSYVTIVTTSFLYNLSGGQGSVAIIQDMTNFLPVWVLPLVMGGLFGIVGLLFGGILGLGMGAVLGVIPLWLVFLLGLGVTYLLVKRGF